MPTLDVEAPVTPAEMVEMFGTEKPPEVLQLLLTAPGDWTFARLWTEVRRMGAERKREREAAEAVRAIENRWLALLNDFGRAIEPDVPEAEGRAAHSRLRAYEAEHHAVVRALRQRLDLRQEDTAPPAALSRDVS